jgi:hypothetical protein
MPSTYTAATVSDLIADINAANQAGGSNTIVLAANTRFVLTGADNTTNGPNGLPVIAVNDNLTIAGQGGDIISPLTAGGFYYGYFRCFDVANGAVLTLSNLTLSDFDPLYEGFGGGAIYNQGTLVLNAVNVQHNFTYWPGGGIWSSGALTLTNGTVIQGNEVYGLGGDAAGGGIWSSGALTLESGTVVQGNAAVGGSGATNTTDPGGNAFGGGLYIAAGTANLTGVTVESNSAQGGPGAFTRTGFLMGYTSGPGGSGFGGGLYATGGATVTLNGDSVEFNAAAGGDGTMGGTGNGGGLYTAAGAIVTLSEDSVEFNTAAGGRGTKGGNGNGGGLYTAAGGTVTLRGDTVESNTATGGRGARQSGKGYGGGLFIDKYATLDLDALTLADTINNTADRYPNIDGSYVLQ